MTEIPSKSYSVLFKTRRVFVELKKTNVGWCLLYTTETELDKKWDFYKAIYRKYVTNDF
jgi:hypothetical protein